MKNKNRKKSWGKMSAAELAAATKQFDKPLASTAIRPLSRRNRARWERAKKAGFKSVYVGKKEKLVLEVDADWLERFDRRAAEHGMTRKELISRGLRSAMAFVSE
jgi:hypothetical protein